MKIKHYLFLPIMTLIIGLSTVGCGKTPLTSEQENYAGKWIASDGTYVEIFLDGGGNVKTSSTDIQGGNTTINDQEIIVGLGPIQQKYQVTQKPTQDNGQWTLVLNNITYTKNDSLKANNSNLSDSKEPQNNPSPEVVPVVEKTTTDNNSIPNNFTQKIEDYLTNSFNEQTGIPVGSVACPENIPIKADYNFSCKITAEDNSKIDAEVVQTNDKGSINWKADKGLISLVALEDNIKGGIKQQLQIETEVDCGSAKFKIAHTGDSFTCNIQESNGKTGAVKVAVQDESGNVKWELN